ncbi:MAG: hypothetical protein PHV77_02365 [Candidatus Omnitrophica bacterium]|jgi:uncharacterized protein YuzE|nr:hypothetical protein [Candidatus Omnitrophota bacterium]
MDRQKPFAPLRMAYDKTADVLYLCLGVPKKGISDMDENGIIIRKDPITKKVFGLTIVDFQKKFSSNKPRMINKHLMGIFQMA